MATSTAPARRRSRIVIAIGLLVFIAPGARLAAQGPAVGTTPEDSVRAL